MTSVTVNHRPLGSEVWQPAKAGLVGGGAIAGTIGAYAAIGQWVNQHPHVPLSRGLYVTARTALISAVAVGGAAGVVGAAAGTSTGILGTDRAGAGALGGATLGGVVGALYGVGNALHVDPPALVHSHAGQIAFSAFALALGGGAVGALTTWAAHRHDGH